MFPSIHSVTGRSITAAMGDMYISKFIELSFSPSEVSRMPCTTDLRARPAVEPMQTRKPKR
ncbi:hypothetical protein IEQ34_005311 [Dendrobium chrysotoxum]|uniref:Uncharacterized protein n=1 Tax=Dendrobium chrysotoxum TaxID=161865 RepID=A0AAV7HB49_DENCH|nr:hypothetical protein IEQ34_005311 [Dendrobium chrysotoxum]